MANIGGLRLSKHHLLMTMAESILLYGAESWADVLSLTGYRKHTAVVQLRGVLRLTCSFCIVLESAVLVITSTIPIDILARNGRRYLEKRRKSEIGEACAVPEMGAHSMQCWQK